MILNVFPVMAGVAIFFIACGLGSILFAEMIPSLKVEHMQGTLLINCDRIQSIFYLKKSDPGSVLLKIMYEGNMQGKEITGVEADEVWERISKDKIFFDRFVWVSHLKGTLGIPLQAIHSAYFTSAKGGKPAQLRILYTADTKVIKGTEAETVWNKLQEN